MGAVDLYQDMLLDHARQPRHVGPVPAAERQVTHENRLCGDAVTVYVAGLAGGGLAVGCATAGCALCRASASIMAQSVQGLLPAAARAAVDAFLTAFPGTAPPAGDAAVVALYDLRRYPTRERCVLLPWEALEKALVDENPPLGDNGKGPNSP